MNALQSTFDRTGDIPISVVICTHNPRPDYFARCLNALQCQTLSLSRWELIVVDNASAPELSSRLDLTWHPRARLIGEPKLGLTAARLCGIRESCGDLLVLVDDDNVVAPDYLERALLIADGHPFLGSWSGQCLPKFDVDPPDWTRPFWGTLCIREFETDVWSNLPLLPDTMPCGAGLCARRAVALHYLGLHDRGCRSAVLDRVGMSLTSGGDNDLAACACDLKLGVGLFSALRLTHLIPPQRLTLDYLCRLVEGIEYSATILRAERGSSVVPRGLVGRTADLLRILRHRGPQREIQRAAFRGRTAATNLLTNKLLASASDHSPPARALL